VSGFSLLKAPKDVSLLEVYRAVEQSEDVHVFDVHQNPSDECIVGRNIHPVLNGMFRQAEQVVERELAGATRSSMPSGQGAPVAAPTLSMRLPASPAFCMLS
jgi:DNA-binding IscR family transcriptional regulator